MHERSMMLALMRELERMMQESGARRVVAVFVKVGALAPITPLHFREHFQDAIAGTFADGAFLSVRQDCDPTGPFAQDVVVESVEVED